MKVTLRNPHSFHRSLLITIFFLALALHGMASPASPTPAIKGPDWEKQVKNFLASPCVTERTETCLVRETVALRLADKKELNVGIPSVYAADARADLGLIAAVINAGDQQSASKLLKLIPESASAQRLPLLFTAGEYATGMKELTQFQETNKYGVDKGAVWALVQASKLDKAFELSKIVLGWRYEDPMPGQKYYTHSSGCVGDPATAYPRAIGILAQRLAQEKKYTQAHELVEMLYAYIVNNLNGGGHNNCDIHFAKWAYQDAIFGLAEALAKNGELQRARAVYEDAKSQAKITATSTLLLATEMKNSGFGKEAAQLSTPLLELKLKDPKPEDETFFEQEVRENRDDASMVMGIGGDYEQAVDRLESLAYPNIQLNTLIDIAQLASRNDDLDSLAKILPHITAHLGHRYRPIDNAMDYLDVAALRFDTGDKEGSESALQAAQKIYDPSALNFGAQIDFGRTAVLLFAKLKDYTSMAAFMKGNLIDYSENAGQTLANILSYFADNELWKDFDTFLSDYGALFEQKLGDAFKEQFSLGMLGDVLLKKREFDRYLTISDTMESPAKQHWSIERLVAAGFKKDAGIPDNIFEESWKRNLEGCSEIKAENAEKKMIGCYMELIGQIQDVDHLSRTRSDGL